MPVGCMVIVDAKTGGVMYTQNPMGGKDDFIHISSTWGLTKSVVDGNVTCDQYVVSKTNPGKVIFENIGEKELKTVCSTVEGLSHYPLEPGEKKSSSLTKVQLKSLVELALELEKYYGVSLDIEWAINDNQEIYILQCRPLQKISDEIKYKPTIPVPDIKTHLITDGITASPGIACGPIFQVSKIADIPSFPAGAILVTREARPKWAPLLRDAAAVITERGGFAGHLANVAREFGVPAIFNMENALEQLENGRLITLDANKCSIYDGLQDNLTVAVSEKKNLMAGSPVYKTLEKVSRLIVPLKMLDPD